MKHGDVLLSGVPLIHQPKGSLLCQLGAFQMVLAYYGESHQSETLLAELDEFVIEGRGLHSQGIALSLLRRGFDVRFSHHDSCVVDPETSDLSEKDLDKLTKVLDAIPESSTKSYRRKKLVLDKAILQAGGRYSTALPELRMVDDFLNNSIPVILIVRVSALRLAPTITGNHAIVIVGRTGRRYLINDPDSQFDRPYFVNADRLQYAWYLAGCYAVISWKGETDVTLH